MAVLEKNMVGWFEIPVSDMDRAIRFYENVLGLKLFRNKMGPLEMAWFPWTKEGTGATGSLVKHPGFYKPSGDGILIYFTAISGDLNNELARVELAGGKILIHKKLIALDVGYMAVFHDSEGNRIALHSSK
jgi:predicted enzyme related to lactoylglutathione lyase